MNERIKELADQAGVSITAADKNGVFTLLPDKQKKFAELIVLEMCQVMKVEGEQFSLDQNFDAVKGVGRCMRKVKEHFGVDK